jgi:hypothetical protein
MKYGEDRVKALAQAAEDLEKAEDRVDEIEDEQQLKTLKLELRLMRGILRGLQGEPKRAKTEALFVLGMDEDNEYAKAVLDVFKE